MIFKRIITLRSIARGVIAGILTTLISSVANAHDIPSQVTLQSFVKPESNQLKVLIRIPMDALSEISFPTRGPGYLLFSEAERTLRDAAQVYVTESIEIYENGLLISEKEVLEIRVSLPSNRSFTSYEQALENIRKEPLEDSINMYWAQGMFDILISYPIQSETSDFSINPGLDRLGVTTTTGIRFLLPGGGERAFTIIGHTGVIVLDPSWSQAFFRFVSMGFSHILDGIDHLLFLFCLVIPLRNIRALIPVITSFTIAHSITLIGSAFGLTPTQR